MAADCSLSPFRDLEEHAELMEAAKNVEARRYDDPFAYHGMVRLAKAMIAFHKKVRCDTTDGRTPTMRGTLALSWGRNGGFYAIRRRGTWRVCLWRVALTFTDTEIDDLMRAYADA